MHTGRLELDQQGTLGTPATTGSCSQSNPYQVIAYTACIFKLVGLHSDWGKSDRIEQQQKENCPAHSPRQSGGRGRHVYPLLGILRSERKCTVLTTGASTIMKRALHLRKSTPNDAVICELGSHYDSY